MFKRGKEKRRDGQAPLELWVIFSLLTFITLFIYFPSLNYPFHFDDYPNIVENPYIKDIKNVSFFIEGLKKQGTIFRAIPTATFALNYYFHKLNPFGYRLINLWIHIFSGFLVYLITIKLLEKDFKTCSSLKTSLFISLLFLVHPVQINTVVYIVQRNEGLSSLFILLSLFLFIQFREKEGRQGAYYFIGVILSVLGAIFSKEIGFMAIGMILLYDLIFTCHPKEEIIKRLKYYAFFFIPIAVYLLFFFKGGLLFLLIKGSPEWFWTPIDNLRTQSNVILQYIKILIFPWPGWLNIDHDFKISKTFFEYPTFFSILALSFILLVGILQFRKKRLISFAILSFFILLAPTSSLIPLWDIMVEYRLYLPIIFYGLLFSVLLEVGGRFFEQRFKLKNGNLMLYALVVLILIYSFFHYQRLKKFESETALWEDAVQKSSEKARPYLNLGIALYKEGKFEEALKMLQTALQKYPPRHPLVYYNLGLVYSDLGRYENAISCLMNFLEENKNDPKVYYEIGHIYLRMGEIEKAETFFKKSLELDSHWGPSYGGIGDILFQKGLIQEAIVQYEKAIKYSPDSAPLYLRKGEAHLKIGQEEKALLEVERAINIDPRFSEAFTFLGGLYLKRGEGEKAFKNLKKAIELNPKIPEAFNNLGLFYRAKGEIEKAIEHYQKAINLNPEFFDSYINLGEAYGAKKSYEEAIQTYQRAIAIEPKKPEPYNNLGVIYLERKNIDEAILYFKKAIQLKTDYKEGYHNLAIAYYYKKDFPKVIQYVKKALNLGYPIDPKLKKLVETMEEKKSTH